MVIETMMLIVMLAVFCEWLDSAIGMGYGTILSPILILLGFPITLLVPSILLTQAMGGLTASFFHHKYKNVDLGWNLQSNLKDVLFITLPGVLATILAVGLAVTVSKVFLSTYIATLVFIMGIIMLSGIRFIYSIKKTAAVGVISAFNKGLSGGGFGPVVTGGQLVLGQESRTAIGCTTAAEFPICMVGFAAYMITKGISDWILIGLLGIGSIIGAIIGPLTTKHLDRRLIIKIVGVLLLILSTLTFLTTYNVIHLKIGM